MTQVKINCKFFFRIISTNVHEIFRFSPGWVKLNQWVKLVYAASARSSTQHSEARTKRGMHGIKILSLNGATCLIVDCCFNELAL